MKDSFNEAAGSTPPAAPTPAQRWDQGIVTRNERDMLAQGRDQPAPALTLEPGTPEANAVDQAFEQHREIRIRHIDRRLDVAREGFERNVDDSFSW